MSEVSAADVCAGSSLVMSPRQRGSTDRVTLSGEAVFSCKVVNKGHIIQRTTCLAFLLLPHTHTQLTATLDSLFAPPTIPRTDKK